LKYFLVQRISSFIFLLSVLLNYHVINILIIISLILKLGVAPFHQWLLFVCRGLNWLTLLILLTLLKIIPLIILINLKYYLEFKIIFLFILSSTIVGRLGGLGQSSLRLLLTYSSINQISWLLVSILINFSLFICYIIIYFMISFFLFFFVSFKNLYYLNQLINFDYIRLICIIFILSLGGLPPFRIFFLKFIVFYFCFLNNYIFGCFILIFSSLISLFYYIRFSIYLFINSQFNFNFLDLRFNLKLVIYLSFFSNIFSFIFLFYL